MFVEDKGEKGRPQPQVNRTHTLDGRRIFNIRWETIVVLIFVPAITIQLFMAWELYKNWKNMVENINYTGTVKRYEKVSNVAKLKFNSYLRDFNKTYNYEEYMRRFENFQASLKDIARLNKLENNTVFGLTKFSDMSKEEFAARMLLRPFGIPPCQSISLDCSNLQTQTDNELRINKKYRNNPPRSFDWRLKGAVKPVLNQKRCNGCWAFSIVGVLESMSAIELNDSRSRSIQELLDCSPDNNGCYNGSVTIAMKYICNKELHFVTEEEYPLTLSMEKTCKLPTTDYHSGKRVKRFKHYCNKNEDEIVEMIAAHGPLIAAVDSSNWINYIGGVITRACTRGVSNHVVQIVGYKGYKDPDAATPIPYYIVRNSYGEDFGDKGYVKIAMKQKLKSGDIHDVCGIAEQITAMDVM